VMAGLVMAGLVMAGSVMAGLVMTGSVMDGFRDAVRGGVPAPAESARWLQ
jgi:hypothetical protein